MSAGGDQSRYRVGTGKVAVGECRICQVLAQYQQEGRAACRCQGYAGRTGQVREVFQPGPRLRQLITVTRCGCNLPTEQLSQRVELAALSARIKLTTPNQWDGVVFPSIFTKCVIASLSFRDTGQKLPPGAPPVDDPIFCP